MSFGQALPLAHAQVALDLGKEGIDDNYKAVHGCLSCELKLLQGLGGDPITLLKAATSADVLMVVQSGRLVWRERGTEGNGG